MGHRFFLLVVLLGATSVLANKVRYSVQCSEGAMVVRVPLQGVDNVELEKWGVVPGCGTTIDHLYYKLTLPLDDHLYCGTTRVRNKLTGETLYYHRVGVESEGSKHVILVKCRVAADNSTLDNIVKRDVLPPEFVEPDFIEITSEVTGTAPIPILGVGVRQNGQLVGGQINVRPGTPLTMEVFLDDNSADIYGILMSYMEVTDTEDKRETIIFNGCSVDPVLFDNFVTTTGDYVSAKFRAFKFPETNYVLFRGTVDVCLDKCQGIACSNGQLGYGRRRRGVDSQPADPNKIFEVTMMTFLKIDENKTEEIEVGKATLQKAVGGIERAVDGIERAAVGGIRRAEEGFESGIERAEEGFERVAGIERAAEDLVQRVVGDVERVLEAENPSFRSREGEGPVYIYYNAGSSNTHSIFCMLLFVMAFLLR